MDTVTWTTLEFEPKERHRDWNWYVALVAGIVAIVAFFYGNIFFGIFAIIAGATMIIYALRPPKHLTIVINKDGIVINDELLHYTNIKQFWLDETEKPDKLLLLVRGSFVPMLSLSLQDVSAETVRETLSAYIPEAVLRESRSIKIFDFLGF